MLLHSSGLTCIVRLLWAPANSAICILLSPPRFAAQEHLTFVLEVEYWIKSVQPSMTKNCHFLLLLLLLHWSTQHMKALGHMVSEKKIFFRFSHDAPGAGPVWTPGAQLAGFIKRTTIHCLKQNMKALGLVVLEKKDFLKFFP